MHHIFSNMASAKDVNFISREDLELLFNVLDIDDLEEDVELQDSFETMSEEVWENKLF